MRECDFADLTNGEKITAVAAAALKYPVIPTALDSYAEVRHTPGAIRRARVVFRKMVPRSQTYTSPTITVTDDSGSAHAAVPILEFPTGVVQVLGFFSSMKFTKTAGTWTSPVHSFGIASGTGAACSSSTLSGAQANLLASSAYVDATVDVNEDLYGVGAITDSTGFAASTTATFLPIVSNSSTDVSRLAAAVATIAKLINNNPYLRCPTIDGSGTAAKLYLNIGVSSSPATLTTVIATTSYVDIWYRFASATTNVSP